MTPTPTEAPTPVKAQPTAVKLMKASTLPAEDAVVTVSESPVGVHVGIWYPDEYEKGTRRHLHLAFHLHLQNESAHPGEALWVVPTLDELALADVRRSAMLIARKHADGRVPYAFRSADALFAEGGVLQLNQSLGLTCATFLNLVFAHAGVTLLDVATWDGASAERQEEDKMAQELLVGYLRQMKGTNGHADLVEKEIGCMRIRAEEVAAASGLTGHPLPFAVVEPEGRRILAIVRSFIAREVKTTAEA